MRKGSEWWNEKIVSLVKEKKEVYGWYLQGKSTNGWEKYKRNRELKKRQFRDGEREYRCTSQKKKTCFVMR